MASRRAKPIAADPQDGQPFGLDAAARSVDAVRAEGGFLVPLPLSLLREPTDEADAAMLRAGMVLELRQAGYEVRTIGRHACEVRIRSGVIEYRTPGRRGAWAKRDPDHAEVAAKQARYLAELHKLLRPYRMPAVRAGRAGAKADRDASIVEALEALGLTPRPLPVRNRAAVVAKAIGCSARHVRATVAKWQAKKSGTG